MVVKLSLLIMTLIFLGVPQEDPTLKDDPIPKDDPISTEKRKENDRDPFAPSDRMLEQVFGNGGYPGGRSARGLRGGAVPQISVKGFAEGADGEKVSLIELKDAGTFLVREGDRLTFDPAALSSDIEILKVDRHGVTVRSGTPPREWIFR